MKREIDALQIQAMKSDRPWYKQVPVIAPLLVSLLALLFSFATTYVAEHRVAREERHDARVELRGLIQRLVGLSKENVKLHREYADDSQALAALSSATNTENIVFGQQAADLISELGDDVGASEY
jgi:hypothetical protein